MSPKKSSRATLNRSLQARQTICRGVGRGWLFCPSCFERKCLPAPSHTCSVRFRVIGEFQNGSLELHQREASSRRWTNCLSRNQRRRMRQKNSTHRRQTTQRETNEKFLKKFSSHQLTDNKVSVISKGLKFIPTPVTDETKIRRQLLKDFEQFARRMRLQYIFHGQNKEPHPFHVKSNWIPPVQPSVALESYLESVKVQLAEIFKTIKPEYNLSRNEFRAIAELKHNSVLNLKKADKGTTQQSS